MQKTFPLSKPIKTHGEKDGFVELKELTLKEPGCDLILDHGMPCSLVHEYDEKKPTIRKTALVANPAALKEWMKAVTGLDAATLTALSARDGYDIMLAIWQELNADEKNSGSSLTNLSLESAGLQAPSVG